MLATLLHSRNFLGDVLRTLIKRLRHPEKPYGPKELRVLLLLTLALKKAGMWP